MIRLEGLLEDGQSSAALPVSLNVWPELNRVVVQGEGIEQEYTLEQLEISVRVGNIPRRIIFPDGASFETLDNESADALLLGGKGHQNERWIHRMESHLVWVLVSLSVTVVVLWSLLVFGIPWMAEKTSSAIPIEMVAQMGDQALESLDKLAFSPTQLNELQQQRGKTLMDGLMAGHNDIGFRRLDFRAMKGNIANAFALPSGLIIVTDRLMELADKDEELQAVLAHELGHVQYRHSLRSWLQNSVSALIVASILGDISSITANVAILPTLLLEKNYSQEFEQQADDFAIRMLTEKKIDLCHMVVILSKLEASLPESAKSMPSFLSTHPPTDKRIERLDALKKGRSNLMVSCLSKP